VSAADRSLRWSVSAVVRSLRWSVSAVVRSLRWSVSAVVRSLRWSVSADVALSEKSPYLGGAWVRWGLSNVSESAESCRFEIRGFARSSNPFSFRMNASVFFLPPDEAECVQGPPDLLRIPSGNRHAVARSMIKRPPKSGESPSGEGPGCQPRSAGGNSASRSRPKTCRSSPDRRRPPWRYRSLPRA